MEMLKLAQKQANRLNKRPETCPCTYGKLIYEKSVTAEQYENDGILHQFRRNMEKFKFNPDLTPYTKVTLWQIV